MLQPENISQPKKTLFPAVPDAAECRKRENRERIIDAYFRDFPNAYKIFPLSREDLLSAAAARREHEEFGLLVDGDMPVYGTAKSLAEYGLWDMWRKAPVYLRAGEVTEGMLTEAARLHVSGVDSKAKIDGLWDREEWKKTERDSFGNRNCFSFLRILSKVLKNQNDLFFSKLKKMLCQIYNVLRTKALGCGKMKSRPKKEVICG